MQILLGDSKSKRHGHDDTTIVAFILDLVALQYCRQSVHPASTMELSLEGIALPVGLYALGFC
jgi:hypothetical protein